MGSDSRRLRSSGVSGREITCGDDSAGRGGGREIGRAGGSAAAWIGDIGDICAGRSPSRRESGPDGGGGGIAGLDGRGGGSRSLIGGRLAAAAAADRASGIVGRPASGTWVSVS